MQVKRGESPGNKVWKWQADRTGGPAQSSRTAREATCINARAILALLWSWR